MLRLASPSPCPQRPAAATRPTPTPGSIRRTGGSTWADVPADGSNDVAHVPRLQADYAAAEHQPDLHRQQRECELRPTRTRTMAATSATRCRDTPDLRPWQVPALGHRTAPGSPSRVIRVPPAPPMSFVDDSQVNIVVNPTDVTNKYVDDYVTFSTTVVGGTWPLRALCGHGFWLRVRTGAVNSHSVGRRRYHRLCKTRSRSPQPWIR